MILPVSIAKKLIAMQDGEKIPFSKINHTVIISMLENGILQQQIQGRNKAVIYLANRSRLSAHLKNHLGIDSLENYVFALAQTELNRATAIDVSSHSKLTSIRTFKGFLVNCFEPVDCTLNGSPFVVQPQEGTFTFIYDFETFVPAENITIVGIENSENFRHIDKQKHLFQNIKPLFISRYPQTQSKDLSKWLQSIPNNYLHFGDFDFAGINIYYFEYKKYLQEKAQFFLPENIEQLLSEKGNRDNYNNQTLLVNKQEITEENIFSLLLLIDQYKKGLEQEIFTKKYYLPAIN